MTLLTGTNRLLFFIQCRQSRHSVSEYRKRKSLLSNYRIDRKSDEIGNVYEKLQSPLNELVPVTPNKTSITIDVLDRETYAQLSEWRKANLVRRARRVLPLPISLTTDDKLGYRWKQQFIKSLKKRNILASRNLYDNPHESIPDFVRLMNDTNEEMLREKFPEIYEKFKSIRQSASDYNFKELVNVDKTAYFPFSQTLKSNELLDSSEKLHQEVGFNDEEYENFLKHNELLQFLASNIKAGPLSEYEPEIRSWASQIWLRNYGKSDPSIAPSKVPCSGCGAHLHCTSQNIPGFIPAQKFTLFNEKELESQRCQRCEFLTKYNVSLNVTVSDEEYPNLITKINSNKSLVIILVDLLDFPCSVWPGIVNLIGEKHLIYIVGNKVDLLPKDDRFYLERIKESLKESLKSTHISRESKIRDVSLISAKNGFGVDNLVTKLLRDLKPGQDIYLIGCTNAGKSTLFNVLMQSDLCALTDDQDLMQRATTSIWPGTTLNLLKFPIRKMKGWEMQIRLNRLNLLEKHYIAENILTKHLRRQSQIRYAHLSERINTNISTTTPFLMENNHPLIRTVRNRGKKPFEPMKKDSMKLNYLNDTPGVIYKDQLLNLLTTEELLRTIPREVITPRTYTLRPEQTLFIGGLARIDLTHARQHVWLTVFASSYLPINIVYTEQAKRFYETYIGTEFLAVPLGDYERLKYWPQLSPKEIELELLGWEKSAADIVLSSAGWISITGNADSKCILKTFTPEGRGIYTRQPPILPYAIRLRGRRIPGTPCFENKLFTIDDDDHHHHGYYKNHRHTDEKLNENSETMTMDDHIRRRRRKHTKIIDDERLKKARTFIEG